MDLNGLGSPSKPLNGIHGSPSDDSSIPEMIMSASLQSGTDDSDDFSLSSSTRSSPSTQNPVSSRTIFKSYWSSPSHEKKPKLDDYDEVLNEFSPSSSIRSSPSTQSPVSPRSIFKSYWSSPTHEKKSKVDDSDEVLKGLQTLRMPPLVNDDNDAGSGSSPGVTVGAPITGSSIEQKSSFDDDSVDYHPPIPSSTRIPRRKIMPTPPPATAISSSLIMPRRSILPQQPPQPHPRRGLSSYRRRQWSSTSAMTTTTTSSPHQSCLRKSRYSCSAIPTTTDSGAAGKLHHGMRNHGCHDLNPRMPVAKGVDVGVRTLLRDDFKKSVSFYSRVAVFEFAVPLDQRKGQKGWSNYFA